MEAGRLMSTPTEDEFPGEGSGQYVMYSNVNTNPSTKTQNWEDTVNIVFHKVDAEGTTQNLAHYSHNKKFINIFNVDNSDYAVYKIVQAASLSESADQMVVEFIESRGVPSGRASVKIYDVDAEIDEEDLGLYLRKTGDTMEGNLDMGGNILSNSTNVKFEVGETIISKDNYFWTASSSESDQPGAIWNACVEPTMLGSCILAINKTGKDGNTIPEPQFTTGERIILRQSDTDWVISPPIVNISEVEAEFDEFLRESYDTHWFIGFTSESAKEPYAKYSQGYIYQSPVDADIAGVEICRVTITEEGDTLGSKGGTINGPVKIITGSTRGLEIEAPRLKKSMYYNYGDVFKIKGADGNPIFRINANGYVYSAGSSQIGYDSRLADFNDVENTITNRKKGRKFKFLGSYTAVPHNYGANSGQCYIYENNGAYWFRFSLKDLNGFTRKYSNSNYTTDFNISGYIVFFDYYNELMGAFEFMRTDYRDSVYSLKLAYKPDVTKLPINGYVYARANPFW